MFGSQLLEVVNKGFDLPGVIVDKIACEANQIRVLLVDQIDSPSYGFFAIKTPRMDV